MGTDRVRHIKAFFTYRVYCLPHRSFSNGGVMMHILTVEAKLLSDEADDINWVFNHIDRLTATEKRVIKARLGGAQIQSWREAGKILDMSHEQARLIYYGALLTLAK
jgi:hypothetical protein